MLRIRVTQPDRSEVVTVSKDVVVIGRERDLVDVQVDQKYVSQRHVVLLHGVVVWDQASTNGTLVDGRRIQEPTLLRPGSVLQLGREEVRVQVEPDGPPSEARISGSTHVLGSGRARATEDVAEVLRDELQKARATIARLQSSSATAASASRVEQLEAENRDLRRRLLQLEDQQMRSGAAASHAAPASAARASSSPDTRLREVEERNRILERRLADLERRRYPPDPSGL